MAERKELGRIQRVEFGWGGYQDVMLGCSFALGGKGWGVQTHDGMWGTKRTKDCEWTEESRLKQLGETVMRLGDILSAAKKKDIADLIGVPIEAIFDGNKLVSWRILSEVL